MACCAFELWLQEELPPYDIASGYLLSLAAIPARGAVLAGLGYWAFQYTRRQPFPIQPGDWLWAIQGLSQLVLYGMSLVAALDLSPSYDQEIGANAVVLFDIAALFFVAAGRARVESRWKALLVVAGLFYVGRGVLCWYMPYESLPIGVTYDSLKRTCFLANLTGLCCCLLADRHCWLLRPWTHWVGLGTWLWFSVQFGLH